MRCVVRAELWDLQARVWSCQDTRATCFEVENTLSGKMRLKGKKTKWREMGRIEWKVGVGTTFFSLELRVLFNVLGGAARPLADARVAGRRWVIRSPVARAAVRRVPAWVETAWTGTWEKFEVLSEAKTGSPLQAFPACTEKRK